MPSLLPYLTRFVMRFFAGHSRFRLEELMSLTIDLAIGSAVSIVGEVAVDLSE